jgi:microcompartment protein CcmK/EutM
MTFRVRRILTGHDAEGRSTIIADGIAQNVKEIPGIPGLALTDLWETAGAPASNAGHADAAARPVRVVAPANGPRLRVVEFPPDAAWRKRRDSHVAFDSIGAGHTQDRGSRDAMMHKTSTVDYAIVLKGEIWAVMEKGETLMKAGDVLVQRGTNHSWSVRGSEPALVAFILVSASPLKT